MSYKYDNIKSAIHHTYTCIRNILHLDFEFDTQYDYHIKTFDMIRELKYTQHEK